MSDPGRENNRQFVSIKLVFLRSRFTRQKWSYFRIEISSRILQHRRKKILFLTKTYSITFSFPFADENIGHSNSVSIHYIFSFHLFSFLPFYCPLSLLILSNKFYFLTIALHAMHIFISSSSLRISLTLTFLFDHQDKGNT